MCHCAMGLADWSISWYYLVFYRFFLSSRHPGKSRCWFGGKRKPQGFRRTQKVLWTVCSERQYCRNLSSSLFMSANEFCLLALDSCCFCCPFSIRCFTGLQCVEVFCNLCLSQLLCHLQRCLLKSRSGECGRKETKANWCKSCDFNRMKRILPFSLFSSARVKKQAMWVLRVKCSKAPRAVPASLSLVRRPPKCSFFHKHHQGSPAF